MRSRSASLQYFSASANSAFAAADRPLFGRERERVMRAPYAGS